VIGLLKQLAATHGAPARLRCDNGPELLAAALAQWCDRHGIVLQHIQPGKPNQNAFIERFNKTYRTEVLDAWVFTSLADVRAVTDDSLKRYNSERPHQSLGRMAPRTYLPRSSAA
jgi:putative transposase